MVDYERLDEYFKSLVAELADAPPDKKAEAWGKVLDIINRHTRQVGADLDAELRAAKEKSRLRRS